MGSNLRLVTLECYTYIKEHGKPRKISETHKREKKKIKWIIENRWKLFKSIISRKADELCGRSILNKHIKKTDLWNNEVKARVKEKK